MSLSFNNPTYPGVYTRLEADVPRTITGVSTSITAFVGRALKGPVGAKKIFSWTDYERFFGGIWKNSMMSYAVYDYFLNGGSEAVICRVFAGIPLAGVEEKNISDGRGKFKIDIEGTSTIFVARDPGQWSKNLQIVLSKHFDEDELENVDEADRPYLVNLEIIDTYAGITEKHLKVSMKGTNPRYIGKILKSYSNILRLEGYSEEDEAPANDKHMPQDAEDFIGFYHPAANSLFDTLVSDENDNKKKEAAKRFGFGEAETEILKEITLEPVKVNLGDEDVDIDTANDGETLTHNHVEGIKEGDGEVHRLLQDLDSSDGVLNMGLRVLEDDVDLFNILSIPPYTSNWYQIYKIALQVCIKRRAFLLVDPKREWNAWDKPLEAGQLSGLRERNSGVFFPRILKRDPADEFRIKDFVPSGAVAGIFARTDANVGVWKAPAGIEASLRGIVGLSLRLTDEENGNLNIKAVNCLMDKPLAGPVIWGSRTLKGSDTEGSPWKYIPVIRMGLFLEESLYRGTQWVVFEPNDEPLWSQIRLSIGAFMQNLFRKGAFQGTSPKEAYFVKCDKETTTEYDRNSGIVNIVVGFAPLKPAEFVLIKITQIAGEVNQ